ncbi:unnamed protein product [Paramecium octaurelia]|uniref:Uncharacterized protein n=1 Tax=Paramecium octaurelia TaxID=43137 RepID=A0A8S1X628_PAROT|nr:unnamed protein product [Paramecium octaurelia]
MHSQTLIDTHVDSYFKAYFAERIKDTFTLILKNNKHLFINIIMDNELISITIINYRDGDNVEGPYEKLFKSDCTMEKVLQEFGLDSAIIVANKDIIESKRILQDVYKEQPSSVLQQQQRFLQLRVIYQQNQDQGMLKYKCIKAIKKDQPVIEYLQVNQDRTICDQVSMEHSVIHNHQIAQRTSIFRNIQYDKDHLIELSVIPKVDGEIENSTQMQVQIFSDQIQNKGTYENGNFIREKPLYLVIVTKSKQIQSLIDDLNNKDIVAFQSSKGILNFNKTWQDYFQTESLCKLIALRNEKQGSLLQQIENNNKYIVNVFYNGKQILHESLEKSTNLQKIELELLPVELKGKIDFIIPDNRVVKSSLVLYQLPCNDKGEINLQVIDKYALYEKMETVLKQALEQVQKMKQGQNKIEAKQEVSAYSLILEKHQTIDILSQVVEQLKFKQDKQEQILEIQNITETVSTNIS